jgi:hypothetical protein
MTSATPTLLADLRIYADAIQTKFAVNAAYNAEDQLKAPIEGLLKAAGTLLQLKVDIITEVQEAEIKGRPDVGVVIASLLSGHVELKQPGKGADPTRLKGRDKDQWEKFRNLPNLMYTDGNQWALYRTGERVGKSVRLNGDVVSDGAGAVNATDATALLELLREFFRWEPLTPSTPRAFAEMLAPMCRLLRSEVLQALGDSASALRRLAADWRRYFFPDADDAQFADAYAQTLTYALLLACLSGASKLSVDTAPRSLRAGHRLLAETVQILSNPRARDELELSIALLERVIGAVDTSIFKKGGSSDPWLYFYEDFLAVYDPKMRSDRGVYYTPVQVVQAQVRLVAELLQTRFGAPYNFVDPSVVTLDPASGTGTYILAALQHGLDRVTAVKGKGARVSAATTAAKNMHAFELLVGPYAVAHLRLTQAIAAEGGTLPNDGAHIYLADTLDSPFALPDQLPLWYQELGDEHRRAQQVKQNTQVLVCIGNPPYDRQQLDETDLATTNRKGGWVRFGDRKPDEHTLLDDFIAPLTPLGLGLHAKNLYNDYVYFWRWALWKTFEQNDSPGIVTFITAGSYLRGPGFAGMRQLMRQLLDELWIINLEGDSLGARKSENVFAIRTPVAIATGVRYGTPVPQTPATVRYVRISGTREEKLAILDQVERFDDLEWRECFRDWHAPFLPQSAARYGQLPLLTDLFPWQANGMQFKRSWPIGENAEVLERRWQSLLALPIAKRGMALRETEARTIQKAQPALSANDTTLPAIAALSSGTPPVLPQRYAFRSFDRQWILPDTRLCDRPRPELQRAHSNQQVYLTSLLTEVLGEGPAAVATGLLPDLHHFRGSFGGAHVIPLWRNKETIQPNVTSGLLARLSKRYGVAVAAEELFAYCYALLASPQYVKHFWDELENPGPRIPITKNRALFDQVVQIGRRLIWLHTYGERFVPQGQQHGQVPPGQAKIDVGVPTSPAEYPDKFSYDEHQQELRVGAGVFSNVRPAVWNFSVSGLYVVRSWLGYRMKERAGRASSPLDNIRPERWQFDDELLELLWVLDATVDLLPQAATLLEHVLAGDVFAADELPQPSSAERSGPKGASGDASAPLFAAAGIDLDEDEPMGGDDD